MVGTAFKKNNISKAIPKTKVIDALTVCFIINIYLSKINTICMLNSRNYNFLTTSHQKLLLFLYEIDREINFSEQNIFKNKQWFKREIEKLINFEVVEKINSINKDMRFKNFKYKITFKGKILVETLIIGFNEKDNEYR